MKRKTTNTILFSLLAVLFLLGCKNAFHEPEYNPSDPVVSDGKTYTVTFNRNGGSGTVPDPIKWESGGSINLPYQGGLSRTNYTFGGWNTNASGTGTTFAASAPFTVPNQDVTLYAKWDAVDEPVTPSAPTSNEPGSSSSTAIFMSSNEYNVYSFPQDLDAMWFTFNRYSPGCVSGADRYADDYTNLTAAITVEVYSSGLQKMSIPNDSNFNGIHLYSSSWAGTYYVKVMPRGGSSSNKGSFQLGHWDH